ncbi:MAG: hypothetical protein L0H59_03590, partial [Tomitella sp.]|nr:hypothetical protein [Tomitella sp.]
MAARCQRTAAAADTASRYVDALTAEQNYDTAELAALELQLKTATGANLSDAEQHRLTDTYPATEPTPVASADAIAAATGEPDRQQHWQQVAAARAGAARHAGHAHPLRPPPPT